MADALNFSAQCSSVSRISYSNWNAWSLCTQGARGTDPARLGAMLFADLRQDMQWSESEISKISLTLTFNNAGGNRAKTLSLYQGTQTELTGSGTDMKGAAIGDVSTVEKAYNSTVTVVFDAENNADAFDNLVSWLKDTESLILVLYQDVTSTEGSYSQDYLQITAASLAVESTSSAFYVYDADTNPVNVPAYTYENGAWVPLKLGNAYTE